MNMHGVPDEFVAIRGRFQAQFSNSDSDIRGRGREELELESEPND